MTRGFVLLLMLILVLPVSAQDDVTIDVIRAYFDVSDQAPRLGEPVMLTAIVELPPDASLVEFPDFPTEWGAFMVRDAGEVTEHLLENGWQQYRQPLTVILWDVGDFETPETLVGYTPAGQIDDVFYVPFTPVFFSVPSMLNPDINQNSLRPLKPQIGFFYLPWWAIGAMIVTITGLGYTVRRWMIRRARRAPVVALPPEPGEVARSALVALRDHPPQSVFDQVPEILRRFISEHFGIPALELTTEELARRIRLYVHDEAHENVLLELLQETDLARFAGVPVDADQATHLLDLAIQWVKNTGNSSTS